MEEGRNDARGGEHTKLRADLKSAPGIKERGEVDGIYIIKAMRINGLAVSTGGGGVYLTPPLPASVGKGRKQPMLRSRAAREERGGWIYKIGNDILRKHVTK